MIDPETTSTTTSSAKRWGSAAALLAAGLAGGIVIAGTVSANAATSTPSPSASSGSTAGGPNGPSTQAPKPAETALTPVGRLDTMRVRFAAVRRAVGSIRPALMRFYEALDQAQQQRFAQM